ncbi:MAG: hypothetical protein PHP17_00310 [Candidatus Omnitrophica bacterium]|nr:hypothetical protein [Candidatus Omnitrophota bacterium]
MTKKGSVLIVAIFMAVVLGVMAIGILLRSISENRLAERNEEFIQAFWLAEAGVNRAMHELRSSYSQSGTGLWETSLGVGGYSCDVTVEGSNRRVIARGFIPATGTARITRVLEVVVSKAIPPNFYENAIYSAGDVNLNGDAYDVTGKIRYADQIDNTSNVHGDIVQDASINPLAKLSFSQLLTVAEAQSNVYAYNASGKLVNQATGSQTFPSNFWYSPPSNPADPTTGTPNVVYVLGNLELRGNIGTIGGFFVVVGDVITNPDVTYDATINGNGTVDGAIYTRGEFRVNGGGGQLNVDGGVWAGEEARLNGNATVTYNAEYMTAIRNLGIDADVQVVSWNEQQNPYEIIP